MAAKTLYLMSEKSSSKTVVAFRSASIESRELSSLRVGVGASLTEGSAIIASVGEGASSFICLPDKFGFVQAERSRAKLRKSEIVMDFFILFSWSGL